MKGFSRGVLRVDRCTGLKGKDRYAYVVDPESAQVSADEVLITRSGTPGIAWAPCLQATPDVPLLPSGFVIRVSCLGSRITPAYLCAILNHPLWRVSTSAAAAGKRQRNLSQEHLAQTFVPRVPDSAQELIGSAYQAAMVAWAAELDTRPSTMEVADAVVESAIGAAVPRLQPRRLAIDRVSLLAVAASSSLRIDGRYHRGDVRAVVGKLADWDTVSLESLLADGIRKSSQPTILAEVTDETGPRVVCTAALQQGAVLKSATKATTEAQLATAGDRALRSSDLLVAMDGEGSIGKAAVFTDDYPAVTDSHVAILRLDAPNAAQALACFINSSVGQAQVSIATSGSTGQTQISVADLCGLRIPDWLIREAPSIGAAYHTALVSYESERSLFNRVMAAAAGKTSDLLLESGAFNDAAIKHVEALSEEEGLLCLLDMLQPSMF